LFTNHAKAIDAAKKLHAHVYKGSLLSCVLKKRVDVSTRVDGKGANRAGRLIVRNLHWKVRSSMSCTPSLFIASYIPVLPFLFQVTEQQLRALFLPYGPILSINLPTQPSLLPTDPSKPPPPPRARGFAFIWFLLKKDAEKALEANGKELEGRKIAVDWALSKDKWEEVKEKVVPAAEKSEEKENKSGDEEEEGGDDDDKDESEASDAAQDEDEAMDVDEKVEAVPAKPALPAVEEGSTVFIRNLPFEATEEELRNL
jgi:nucleolar protein 4